MNVRSDNQRTRRRRKPARAVAGTKTVRGPAVRDDALERRHGRPLVDDKLRQLAAAETEPKRGRGRPLVDDKRRQLEAAGIDPPRRGRGRPLVDDKRRRILDAALATFSARGYHGTSVPEVAQVAGVGVGTLYRYFADKNALVNELYRDAKLRLRAALLDGLPAPDSYRLDNAQPWFAELWSRLAAFARTEPEAFRFLEMQDHVEYLDAESRELELSVLAPLWLAGKRLRERSGGPPVDVAIALLWGAFVGVVKANRLGYLPLDERRLEQAGAAAWRMIAPEIPRAAASESSRGAASEGSRAAASNSPRTRKVSAPRTTRSKG